jgi:hypothetical protein
MKLTLLRVFTVSLGWLIVSMIFVVWIGSRQSKAMGQDTFFFVTPIRAYLWVLVGPPLLLLLVWLWQVLT